MTLDIMDRIMIELPHFSYPQCRFSSQSLFPSSFWSFARSVSAKTAEKSTWLVSWEPSSVSPLQWAASGGWCFTDRLGLQGGWLVLWCSGLSSWSMWCSLGALLRSEKGAYD